MNKFKPVLYISALGFVCLFYMDMMSWYVLLVIAMLICGRFIYKEKLNFSVENKIEYIFAFLFNFCIGDFFWSSVTSLPVNGRIVVFLLSLVGVPFAKAVLDVLFKNGEKEQGGEIIVSAFCVLFSLFVIAVQTVSAFSYDIWFDEAYSLEMIKHSYSGIVSVTSLDVHPPLYYFILKTFVDGVHIIAPQVPTIFIAKFTSVVPYIIVFFAVAIKVRKQWGNTVSNIGLLCLSVCPAVLRNAVEIRMYAWGLCFAVLAYIAAFDVLKYCKKKSLIFVVIFVLLAAYSNYWCAMAAGTVFIALFFCILFVRKELIKAYFLAVAGLVLGFLPQLFIFGGQADSISGGYWISEITPRYITEYLRYCFGSNINIVFFFFAVYLIYKKLAKKEISSWYALFTSFAPLFVCFAGVSVSLLFRPIFVMRYLIPGLFCFWFGEGAMVVLSGKRRLIGLFGAVAVAVSAVNAFSFYSEEKAEALQAKDTVAFYSEHKEAAYLTNNSHSQGSVAVLSGRPCYNWKGEFTGGPPEAFGDRIGSVYTTDEVKELIDKYGEVYFVDCKNEAVEEFEKSGIKCEPVGKYKCEYIADYYALSYE